jgi:hypothetical protein
MNEAIPHVFSVAKGWYHAKHSLLLGDGQRSLKSNQAKDGSFAVLLAKLDDGEAVCRSLSEADGAHRTKSERVVAPSRNFLDGQTPLEVLLFVQSFGEVLSGRLERMHKCIVLLPRQGTVQIIGGISPSGAQERRVVVNRMSPDGGSNGIVEEEILTPEALPELMEKIRTGERACCKDGWNRGIEPSIFFPANGNERIALDTLSHQGAELVLVDREGLACRKTARISAPHDGRIQESKFGFEKASRVPQGVRAKGIAADKFSESVSFVDVGLVQRPHFP